MVTIKGPIRINTSGDNTEFFKKVKEAGGEIRLPFTATGFKSSKTSLDIVEKKVEVETVKEHIRDVDPTPKVEKKKIKSYKRRKRSR